MSEEILATHPPNEGEKLLEQKFYEEFVKQSERVDALSAHLLSIELAIPGIYATVLKLVSGEGVNLGNTGAVRLTFFLWFIALILTLIALTPKKYTVNTGVYIQTAERMEEEGMGIEDYFSKSAQYKRKFALASALFFFAGIVSAVFTIG